MKKTFKPALFVLLMFGVFGVDEVKAVSVMEGDSVTLNPDRTQIQGFNEIEWRFKDSDQPIAYSDGRKPTYPVDERFRDRLKLNQTGSLTITNMKTKHSGLYKLQIELNSGSLTVNFDVNVYESPSVINTVKGEMKFKSVKKGDPVTLQTDVTQLSGDELIVWRCGEEGKLIAKADIEAKSSPLYDTDEGFRDRLELDHQTGSLIITNTRTTDSGYYTVKISSKKQTVYKRFTVTVTVSEPGLSSGAIAGIVLLCVAVVVVAAAAAGVAIYYRHQNSELQKQTSTVTVTEGEDVILKPNKAIKKDDSILWLFGDEELQTRIAEIRTKPRQIVINDDALFGRFRGKLELDDKTGSLTIKNSRTEHSGLYKLHITSICGDSEQRFMVTVNENVEEISVDDAGSVTLYPDPLNPDTQIQRDNQIMWLFGDHHILIAEIREGNGEAYDNASKRFSGRLQLNVTTGSLTIRNITTAHTGLYRLLTMSSSRGILCKKFWVSMPCSSGNPVNESASVEIPLMNK